METAPCRVIKCLQIAVDTYWQDWVSDEDLAAMTQNDRDSRVRFIQQELFENGPIAVGLDTCEASGLSEWAHTYPITSKYISTFHVTL